MKPMQSYRGLDLDLGFGAEFTRMMDSVKLTPFIAQKILGVDAGHIAAVMAGQEPPSESLEKALDNHPPLYVGDLYALDARKHIPLLDNSIDGVVLVHAHQSDATKRTLYRGPADGTRLVIYDYADTAVLRGSETGIIPERIWEHMIIPEGKEQLAPLWAFNNGHFEQQMTLFIGKVTIHWQDLEGKVHYANMETGDMEYHGPFPSHLFTKREEDEALIVAATYRGALGNREFLDEIKGMNEEEYLTRVRQRLAELKSSGDIPSLSTGSTGFMIQKNGDTPYTTEGVYSVRTLLKDVPFQPGTEALEYTFKQPQANGNLDIKTESERWGYVLEDPVRFIANGYNEVLEPGSSFYIKPNVPHAIRPVKDNKGKVVVMQVTPGLEDAWNTIALTLEYAGIEGVERIRYNTKQWTG